MVTRVIGGGRALPTLTSQGWFSHHDGMYAGKSAIATLCVLCVGHCWGGGLNVNVRCGASFSYVNKSLKKPPEIIEWFIDDQAFSVPYDLSPHPPPPPLLSASYLSFYLSLPVCRWLSLRTKERGIRGGGGAKSYNSEKSWSSTNHSILSGNQPHPFKQEMQKWPVDSLDPNAILP